MLPQALAFLRRRRIDAVLPDFGLQRDQSLPDERRRAIAHVEPDIDGQDVLLSEPREQPGLQQRGLAQAGLPEQDRQRCLAHEAQQLGRLSIAAAEEMLRPLVERAQARPGVLGVDEGARDEAFSAHAGRWLRRSRISRVISLRRSSLRLPSGAWPKWVPRKLVGTRRKIPASPS